MRAAHAIKGSAANIGGNEVAAARRDHRKCGARTDLGRDRAGTLIELDQAYERLREAVRAYRAGIS